MAILCQLDMWGLAGPLTPFAPARAGKPRGAAVAALG